MNDTNPDVVVIGAGPGGEELSLSLAKSGHSVVVVERELVGGECAFWGCMPSKALLRPAGLVAEASRYRGVDGARIDAGEVLAKRDEAADHLDDSAKAEGLRDNGIKIVRGAGKLVGEREVWVDGQTFKAREAVVIATGATAAVPEELAEAKPWTSREITQAQSVPESLVVVGGGYIGCEMAAAWNSLGSEVQLIAGPGGLLEREVAFAADLVEERLRADGIEIIEGDATGARREGGEVIVELGSDESLRAKEFLVAIGRQPRSQGLGLDPDDLDEDGSIHIDSQLRVGGRDWLYAIGDVNGRARLTHEAKEEARIVAKVIDGSEVSLEDERGAPPHVIFTHPQIAGVGHTEETATDAGLQFDVIEADPGRTAAATFVGGSEGTGGQLLVESGSERLLGACFCGPEVADLLHPATLAISAELTLTQLCNAIPVFPTRSELWLQAKPGL